MSLKGFSGSRPILTFLPTWKAGQAWLEGSLTSYRACQPDTVLVSLNVCPAFHFSGYLSFREWTHFLSLSLSRSLSKRHF